MHDLFLWRFMKRGYSTCQMHTEMLHVLSEEEEEEEEEGPLFKAKC